MALVVLVFKAELLGVGVGVGIGVGVGVDDGVGEGVCVGEEDDVAVVKLNDQLLLQSLQLPPLSFDLILQYQIPSVKTGL